MKQYGIAPEVLDSNLFLYPTEFLYYQDLPIIMPGEDRTPRLPKNLEWTRKFVEIIQSGVRNLKDCHVYLSARHMFYDSEFVNRPGWHSDGFGTNDLSIIWSNAVPTEFCIQPFNLSNDCEKSMLEMEEQVRPENIKTYSNRTVLFLDESVIHRVSPKPFRGIRTFLKASISENQYNLEGNSHNYLFDYDWEVRERSLTRNNPVEKTGCK